MKVLVFGLNWVGDVVMSFSAVANAAIGSTEKVDIVTRPHLSNLYKLHPGIGNVWTMDTKRPFWSLLPQFLRLRRRGYDLIVVLPRSFRSAWHAFLCGGKTRVGYAAEGRSLLLTLPLPLPSRFEKLHESRLHVHLMAAAGLPDYTAPLPTVKRSREGDGAILDRFGLRLDEDYAVIAPGAAFGEAKRWPAERFAEVALRLHHLLGWRVVVTGSAPEAGLTGRVAAALPGRAIDLGGRTSLEELIPVLGRARLLVANDSGTMHLGALLKIPVAVPVGSTDMARTGPMTELAALVRTDACRRICREPTCPRGTHDCMRSISVDAMMAAITPLLARARSSARAEGVFSHG